MASCAVYDGNGKSLCRNWEQPFLLFLGNASRMVRIGLWFSTRLQLANRMDLLVLLVELDGIEPTTS